MKTKSILFAILFSLLIFKGRSQITLAHTYSTGVMGGNYLFNVIKLSHSGYKYVNPRVSASPWNITLYNMDHTVFKVLPVPTFTANQDYYMISETLFNSNPADVEFLLMQTMSSSVPSPQRATVFDETGAVLFSRDSVWLAGQGQFPVASSAFPYTSTGVKLLLANRYSDRVFVYSLPGELPCSECTDGKISGLYTPSSGGGATTLAFPNPSNNEIKIEYKLPTDNPKAKISFYTIDGKELKIVDIDNHIDYITVTKESLGAASGMYMYKIYNSSKIISTGKVIFE